MRKIKLTIIKNGDFSLEQIKNVKLPNQIRVIDNQLWYKSRHDTMAEKVSFSIRYLKIDLNFSYLLKNMLLSAYEEAKEISNENMGIEIQDGSLNSLIDSLIQKYIYPLDDVDIFDFVISLFVGILMGHKLTNGNKRLSLTFLKAILWEFGYYLKWTQGNWKNYTEHKTVVEKFVINLESNSKKNKRAIYKWDQEMINW